MLNEKKSLMNQTIGNVNKDATVPGKSFKFPIPKLDEKRNETLLVFIFF